MKLLILALTCIATVYGGGGERGIDLSAYGTRNYFRCLRNQGFDFVIVRAYRSNGRPDSNAVHTIDNARKAGFEDVDVYMFPCLKCQETAQQQVQEMYNGLQIPIRGRMIDFGRVWLDIEESEDRQHWSRDSSTNQHFFEELLDAVNRILGRQPGVYTNKHFWDTIMGSTYTGGSSYDLWYAHYENTPNPSFSDYKPFGGWKNPAMKQYRNRYTGSCRRAQMPPPPSDLNWKPY